MPSDEGKPDGKTGLLLQPFLGPRAEPLILLSLGELTSTMGKLMSLPKFCG